MFKNKKFVFWGAGRIANNCILHYAKEKPEFIIDTYSNEQSLYGIPIIKPHEVKEWSKLFIVIAVKENDSIIEYLKNKGLQENEDFEYYIDYFHIINFSAEKTLSYVNKSLQNKTIYKNSTLISAPFIGYRGSENIFNFFQCYTMTHKKKRFISLCPISYLYCDKLHKNSEINYVPYMFPSEKDMKTAFWKNRLNGISIKEKNWITALKYRKKSKPSIKILEYIYIYLKEMLNLLLPSEIIWWGGWSMQSYIIEYLAEKMQIPFCFAEYGWLPKTIQFDTGGIAGQSIFCKKNIVPSNITLSAKSDIYKARNKFQTELEPRIKYDGEELSKINNLNADFKTVLFVGMGDAGMDMNPKDKYWNKYISSCVSGSLDAFNKIKKICKKSKWNLIFKPHPKELPNQKQVVIREDKSTILIKDVPIEILIEKADLIVSITSAVDYEVIMMGKPLVQLGKNSLNKNHCSYVVKKSDEIAMVLKKAMDRGLTVKQISNYNLHMEQLLKTVLWNDMTDPSAVYGRLPKEDIFSLSL